MLSAKHACNHRLYVVGLTFEYAVKPVGTSWQHHPYPGSGGTMNSHEPWPLFYHKEIASFCNHQHPWDEVFGVDCCCMQTPWTTASLSTFNKGVRCTKMLLPLTCMVQFWHPHGTKGTKWRQKGRKGAAKGFFPCLALATYHEIPTQTTRNVTRYTPKSQSPYHWIPMVGLGGCNCSLASVQLGMATTCSKRDRPEPANRLYQTELMAYRTVLLKCV